MEDSWRKAQAQHESKLSDLDARILNLQNKITMTIQKLKVISNTTTIKYMEEELEETGAGDKRTGATEIGSFKAEAQGYQGSLQEGASYGDTHGTDAQSTNEAANKSQGSRVE